MSKNKTKSVLVKNDKYYAVHLNKKGQPVDLSFFCKKTNRAVFVFTKQTTSLQRGYALAIAECADNTTVTIKSLSISRLKAFINKFENVSVDEAIECFAKHRTKTRRFQN